MSKLTILVVRIIIILLSLIFVKFITQVVSASDLGSYFFLITVSYFGNALVFVPLDFYQQAKVYSFKNNNISFKSFLPLNKKVIFYSIVLIIIVWVLFYRVDYLLAAIFSLMIYIANLIRNFINNLEYRRTMIVLLLLENSLKIIFIYSFYLIDNKLNAESILLSNVLVFFISIPIEILVLRRIILKVNFSGQLYRFKWKNIISFSYPISIGSVLNWVQLQGYRLILVPLGFERMVGVYATVSNIGHSGMGAMNSIINQIWTPNLYKTNGLFLMQYLKYAFIALCFVLGVSLLFSEIIVELLTTTEYAEHSYIILYGIFIEGSNLIIGGIGIYLTIKNETNKSIFPSIVGVLGAALCFFLLFDKNLLSIKTIGIPLVVSQFLVIIFLLYAIRKKHKKKT